MTRRLALLLPALLLVLGTAGHAQAAGYRYWSFWDRTGTHWTYATQGPSTTRPDDGDVQGFRFAVSEDSANAKQPRLQSPDFAKICANSPAVQGKKRIALVIDFGTGPDAPPPHGLRDGHPRRVDSRGPGHGRQTPALQHSGPALRNRRLPEAGLRRPGNRPEENPNPHHGPSVGLLAGATAIVLLAAAAIWRARRQNHD